MVPGFEPDCSRMRVRKGEPPPTCVNVRRLSLDCTTVAPVMSRHNAVLHPSKRSDAETGEVNRPSDRKELTVIDDSKCPAGRPLTLLCSHFEKAVTVGLAIVNNLNFFVYLSQPITIPGCYNNIIQRVELDAKGCEFDVVMLQKC